MNCAYEFDPAVIFEQIKAQTLEFLASMRVDKVVLGISGGKDSTVTAGLMAKILGPENVIGVMMPNGVQADIADSERVFEATKIVKLCVNIGKTYEELYDEVLFEIQNSSLTAKFDDVRINMPPRLRMTALYGVAQALNACVLNTDNECEIVLGYYTLFGDGAGSYGPLRNLTVEEVKSLGRWLGLPIDLVDKKPGDGLQALGDEDRMGISYKEVGNFIRFGKCEDQNMFDKILARKNANAFKTKIIHISAPKFNLPDYSGSMS